MCSDGEDGILRGAVDSSVMNIDQGKEEIADGRALSGSKACIM
jgi:hypothetical protein